MEFAKKIRTGFVAFLWVVAANIAVAQSDTNLLVPAATEETSQSTVYAVYGMGNADDFLPDDKKFIAADYVRPRVRKQGPTKPEMNIPEGFSAAGMLVLLSVFIYVVGLMINDMAKEDKIVVEEIAGNLNC